MITYKMWDNVPGRHDEEPVLEYYKAENRKNDIGIIVFPGGAYQRRAEHEGKGVAEKLNELGYDAFVCEYRVAPHSFPLELNDARRAVRFLRYHADEFGVNKNKIIVMGFSAGANLCALTSTYLKPIDNEGIDDIDKERFVPNGVMLGYPVISFVDGKLLDKGCNRSLLLDDKELARELSPEFNVTENTSPTFIWQVSDDDVTVLNSYLYARTLREHNVPCEMHIFPIGGHGLGTAAKNPHVAQWTVLFDHWLDYLFGKKA